MSPKVHTNPAKSTAIFKDSAVRSFLDVSVPECGPTQAYRPQKTPASARVLRLATKIQCGWRTVARICRRQRFPLVFHWGQLPLSLSYALLRWVLPTRFTTLTRPAIIAATVIATSATATKPAAGSLRTRFIHCKCPSAGVFAVQSCHCLFRFIIVGHLDKTETAGPASVTIGGDRCAVNGSKRLKQRP
jgi:hypothetical protein